MAFTRRAALALAAAQATVPFAARVALASAPTRNRLVLVVLRGALDGLAAVPPLFEPGLGALRPGLGAVATDGEDGALLLDRGFGLHPSLSALHAMYRAGEASFVHAIATPYRDRSHFDAQDILETGATRARAATDGWLNRAIGLMPRQGGRLGIAAGTSVPLVLRGAVPVGSWAPQTMPDLGPDFLALLEQVYRGDAPLAAALAEGRRIHEATGSVLGDDARMAPGTRPGPALRATASGVARLLAEEGGPRIASFDLAGWDTHAAQTQRLRQLLKGLDEVLEALREGLGTEWRRSVVVVATEFGRTVRRNGTGGTDHGTGSVAMLAGGAVAGGRVHGDWPGLAPEKLFQGRDLAPATDMRALFKGVLAAHLGIERSGLERTVFPGSEGIRPLDGLVRA
jgi:uncharacterized protein (DUF1501 family)